MPRWAPRELVTAARAGDASRALASVWRATRFSWWFTTLTHRMSEDAFAGKLQLAELDYISRSTAAATSLAENYAGLGSTDTVIGTRI